MMEEEKRENVEVEDIDKMVEKVEDKYTTLEEIENTTNKQIFPSKMLSLKAQTGNTLGTLTKNCILHSRYSLAN